MKHVSRTHGVALDWLFDRIDFDPRIKIKYGDTKHQLAAVLTKESFTRDECENLFSPAQYQQHQLSRLPSNDGEKSARGNRRGKTHREVKTVDEPGFEDHGEIFNGAEFGCIKKPGDTQSIWSKFESHSQRRETCSKGFESKRHSIELSSVTIRCKDERQRRET